MERRRGEKLQLSEGGLMHKLEEQEGRKCNEAKVEEGEGKMEEKSGEAETKVTLVSSKQRQQQATQERFFSVPLAKWSRTRYFY